MIEGNDVVFENVNGKKLLEPCVIATVDFWPDAVFEYFVGEDFDECNHLDEIPFNTVTNTPNSEIFIYKNEEHRNEWNNQDLKCTENCMLYFIGREQDLTVVVDDAQDPYTVKILEKIKEVVKQFTNPANVV